MRWWRDWRDWRCYATSTPISPLPLSPSDGGVDDSSHDDVDVVVVCGTIFVLSRWPRQKQKADGTRATARAL